MRGSAANASSFLCLRGVARMQARTLSTSVAAAPARLQSLFVRPKVSPSFRDHSDNAAMDEAESERHLGRAVARLVGGQAGVHACMSGLRMAMPLLALRQGH